REGAHPQRQAEHLAHSDLPLGCRAGRGGDLEDRQGQARSSGGRRRGSSTGEWLMSIVALSKVTLYGPAAEKDAVLDGLQGLGCVHLNDLRPGAGEAVASSQSDARQALRYLWDSPVRRPELQQFEDVDVDAVVKEALEIRDR